MAFTVRPAEASDLDALVALHVATWKEAYTHLLPDGFFDDEHTRQRRAMWTRILEDDSPERIARVAADGDRLVGLAMSGPSMSVSGEEVPRERQLYMLYVLAAEYGTGAGQALFDAVIGADPAVLWVAKENPRAIAFYRRNGFEFDGVEQIDPGAPAITDARMVR